MVSQNTKQAINKFRELLNAEQTVRILERDVGVCAVLVPEIEREYYVNETEKLRKISEGRESQP